MNKTIVKKLMAIWDGYPTGLAVLAIIAVMICAIAWTFGLMCLQSWIVMLLWNWVAVGLFGAPALSFWVAFGLRWLCSLLFKSKLTVNKESK